jgi:hypothetical protein
LKKKRLFVFLIGILLSMSLHSAWVDNLQGRVTQPDGTMIDVLFSGDEFHVWAHDENYFTIIQDPFTGFWCWAVSKDGDLISTGYPIHLHTPEFLGLNSRENISVERYHEKRVPFDEEFNSRSVRGPTTGVLNNLVVFIRFSDDEEFTTPVSFYDEMFNATGVGVDSQKQYFWDASYQQLYVDSPFFPRPNGDFIVSYRSPRPRAYFLPFNAVTNPIGYQGGDHGWERTEREHELLRSAILHIRAQVPLDLDLDSNNDGRVDNICFIIRGATSEWATLLWPHRWVLFSHDVFIHGKQVWDYNFNIENQILCRVELVC